MKINSSAFLAILLLAILETCVSGRRTRGVKVTEGRNASVGEFPYQISLQRKYYYGDGAQHICGGAIIDEHHVLTAAHCVYHQFQAQLRVVAGVLNVTDTSEPGRVNLTLAKIYLHEGFDFPTLLNDIALIRVNDGFPLNSSVISAIPLREDHLSPPMTCNVSGWGYTWSYPNNHPDVLQALDLPIISQDTCYPESSVLPGNICAGYMDGEKDACGGDSGGPLQCEGLLSGILSWGNDCGIPIYPGVYTEVAYYKDWIQKTLAKSFEDGGLAPPFFP